jgi:hypothetical protein
MSSEASDSYQSAIDTAEDLRDDLEAIAASDLPFAYDAERILEELDRTRGDDSK